MLNIASADTELRRQNDDTAAQSARSQAPSTDRLEKTLHTVRALLDDALTENRRRNDHVELLPTDDAVRAAIGTELAKARRSVHLSAADTSMCTRWQYADHPIKSVLQRRVTVYQLYAHQVTLRADAREFLQDLDRRGSNIRLAHQRLHTMALIDNRVAILRTGVDDGSVPLLTRAPAVLKTLVALFQAAWEPAVNLADYLQYCASDLDEVAPVILCCLVNGYTDEVAARKLELSVRTYRRRVAEVMRMLNSVSRFQAGVRAAELGLISFNRDACQVRPGVPSPRSSW
jgi:hypothetical protein